MMDKIAEIELEKKQVAFWLSFISKFTKTLIIYQRYLVMIHRRLLFLYDDNG